MKQGRNAFVVLLLCLLFDSMASSASSPSLDVVVDSAGSSYEVRVDGLKWLTSATTRLHTNGRWHSSTDPTNPLVFGGSESFTGSTRTFGPFTGHSFYYLAQDAEGTTPFTITFKRFSSGKALIFEQTFPKGAHGTSLHTPPYSYLSLPQDTPWRELESETQVLSEFPTFLTDRGSLPSLGYLFWTGRFLTPYWGQGLHNVSGIETGPIVLFDGDKSTVVISALNNFKVGMASTNMSNPAGPSLSFGLSGSLTSIPEGFTHQLLFYAGQGITNTIYEWGQAMQDYYSSKRYIEKDIFLNKLSYWTDNGAYYFFMVWQNMSRDGSPQNVFLDVKRQLDAISVPIAAIQMDAWWYNFGNPLACIDNWNPSKTLFPNGFVWLSKQLGIPFSLYTHFFCVANDYEKSFPFLTSVNYTAWGEHGIFQAISSSDSYKFYKFLMGIGLTNAMSNFRVDFLDFNFLAVPFFQEHPLAYEQWLKGMADAALDIGVPIELSMPMPSDILAALPHPMITMARVSDDYPTPTNWDIGTTSILAWTLGVRPNKDCLWTTSVQPDNTYNRIEPSPPLPVITAVLSMGPVGIADKAGYTNATLVMRTCDKGGRLLQPSKPITSIDAMFTFNNNNKVPQGGQVWATYSVVSSFYWFYVLAIDVPSMFKLNVDDLWPSGKFSLDYVYRKDGPPTHDCRNGTLSRNCVKYLREDGFPSFQTPLSKDKHEFGYWVFFPTHKGSKWILLGELDKIVSVSPQRFESIQWDTNRIVLQLVGAPQETVRVWAIDPTDRVVVQEVRLAASGKAILRFGA
jgi:hypothetical protein